MTVTIDTNTNVIRDIARELLSRGVTYSDLCDNSDYYKPLFQRMYHIPASDLRSVYYCIQCFVRYFS